MFGFFLGDSSSFLKALRHPDPPGICDSLTNPHNPHAFKASNALTRPRLRALLREQQFGSQLGFNILTPSEYATVSQIHTIHMLLMV